MKIYKRVAAHLGEEASGFTVQMYKTAKEKG